ncbi:MAG: hypothetical protein M1838_002745 [Thelocarpon superellum]|nr:MAG: hypothetical protein M1838_002745 [Thelocarpon superellum]
MPKSNKKRKHQGSTDGSWRATPMGNKRPRPEPSGLSYDELPYDEDEGDGNDGGREAPSSASISTNAPSAPHFSPRPSSNTSFTSVPSKRPTTTGRVDPSTGLRSAFPGLEDHDSRHPFYGPAHDGLDYLRMVRSEAKGVPDLLVAPREIDDNGEDEGEDEPGEGGRVKGYYADGAYTAAPTLATDTSMEDGEKSAGQDAQSAYYASLLAQYRHLRSQLRDHAVPADALTSLDRDHPTTSSSSSSYNANAAYGHWRHLLQTTDPKPAQVARMDQSTLLLLLRLVTLSFLKRRRGIERRTGRWTWALLGRLQEPGCLVSEEVSVVRELGKRAVWLLVGLQQEGGEVVEALDEHELRRGGDEGEGEREAEAENGMSTTGVPDGADVQEKEGVEKEEDDDDDDEEEEEEDKMEEAKTRLMQTLNNGHEDKIEYHNHDENEAEAEAGGKNEEEEGEVPEEKEEEDKATDKATLHTIITIVGEYYGQRDLLEFRGAW